MHRFGSALHKKNPDMLLFLYRLFRFTTFILKMQKKKFMTSIHECQFKPVRKGKFFLPVQNFKMFFSFLSTSYLILLFFSVLWKKQHNFPLIFLCILGVASNRKERETKKRADKISFFQKKKTAISQTFLPWYKFNPRRKSRRRQEMFYISYSIFTPSWNCFGEEVKWCI